MKKLVLPTLFLIILLSSCNENGLFNRKNIISITHSACKTFYRSANLDTVERTKDMIEYFYDTSTRILKIKHYNAAFNCCPGKIHGEIVSDSFNIIITEIEKANNPCDCSCLYDLEYQIDNLAPGQYSLQIIEPYLTAPDEALKFIIDLKNTTYDTLSKLRTNYPWLL